MEYKGLDILKPIKLYINGKWVSVLPIYKEGSNLIVKNIDKKHYPLIEYQSVDLYWHFTTANGNQIKNVDGKVGFVDKVKLLVRSWI